MIRLPAASAAFVLFALAACDGRGPSPAAPAAPDAGRAASASAAPAEASAPSDAASTAAAAETPVVPAAPGAPGYAALYPGAVLEQPQTVAAGPDGEGGLVTFRTPASPDEVVNFYRERAEQAGLASVTGMNQGDARAYGAAGGTAGSTTLHVVAAPTGTGETSVQLSWSEGL